MTIFEGFVAAVEEVVVERGYRPLVMPQVFRLPNTIAWQFIIDGSAGDHPVVVIASLRGTQLMLNSLHTQNPVYYDLSDPDSLNQIARSLDRHRIER